MQIKKNYDDKKGEKRKKITFKRGQKTMRPSTVTQTKRATEEPEQKDLLEKRKMDIQVSPGYRPKLISRRRHSYRKGTNGGGGRG